MEVKRGRREIGDRDTYDFKLQCSGEPDPNPHPSPKLQCSGVWQSYTPFPPTTDPDINPDPNLKPDHWPQPYP